MNAHPDKQVDCALSCRIRTTQITLEAAGHDPPQPIPEVPLPGRKTITIINNDNRTNGADPGNTRVVVGAADVFFDRSTSEVSGFPLLRFDSITLPADESVLIFAIQDSTPDGANTGQADLRCIEIA